MRTALLTITLALGLLVTAEAKPAGLDSIRPLGRHVTHPETGQQVTQIFCTAWASTYRQVAVWVTAAHCMLDETGTIMMDTLLVDEKPVRPVVISFVNDVAILKGGPNAQPFQVSFKPADVFQAIWSAGYAYGSTRQHVVAGIFSNERDDDGSALYNMAVAPSMSGSPVVDVKTGIVVGMLTQTECVSGVWCPIARGTRLEQLRAVLKPDE